MSVIRVNHDLLDEIINDRISYNGKPFTGIGYELTLEGKLLCEISYEKGIRTGIAREWYDLGQLKDEEYYFYGSHHGVFREWFENGNLKVEGECERSICIRRKEWDMQGNLVQDYRLLEGSPDHLQLQILRKFKFFDETD